MNKFNILYFLLLILSVANAQIVNIPDANFKQYLTQKGIDKNNDGNIQISEAINVDSIDLSKSYINDLIGIEAFTELIGLDCSKNNIRILNLNKNTALTDLYCHINKITLIGVSACLALNVMDCSNNNLTNLILKENTKISDLYSNSNKLEIFDLTSNIELKTLSCFFNQLKIIDISRNINLVKFRCNNNQLITLDISKNVSLTYCDASKNTLLQKICINSNQFEKTKLKHKYWLKDETAKWSVDCK